MDLYSTTTLNRLIPTLLRPQTALLAAFFGTTETSDTEDIKFDVENGKRRIAPFVHPLREGRIVENLGFVTNSFKPAYVKDKRSHNPDRALKRAAGETIGGDTAPADRQQANLVNDMADQLAMLNLRKEVMASEVLRTGKCTIAGDGYPTVLVDFGRNSAHTFTLGASLEWGDVGVVPLTDVETWALLVLKNSGAVVTDVIMDALAWRLFSESTKVQALLDQKNVKDAAGGITVSVQNVEGLSAQGRIGTLNYWVYSGWYVNEAGTEVPMLPDYTVILASKQVEGVQHHGAIKDVEAGIQPMEAFVKSWVVPDPSVRWLLMQSAPLVVPYRPDATLCATVKV